CVCHVGPARGCPAGLAAPLQLPPAEQVPRRQPTHQQAAVRAKQPIEALHRAPPGRSRSVQRRDNSPSAERSTTYCAGDSPTAKAAKCALPHLILPSSIGRSASPITVPLVSTTKYRRSPPSSVVTNTAQSGL